MLLGALLIKLAFIVYLEDRAYHDVFRGIHYGYLLDERIFSIETDHINTKTFLGPLLWFPLFERFGMPALKLVNLALFTLLFALQARLGRDRFDPRTVIAALFIVVFYVGTNRSCVAGEADDLMAALLFTLGITIYVGTRRPLAAGLLMGAGFLFKFSTVIFCCGFGLYLLTGRRWRELVPAGLGMLLPFLLINSVDRGESWQALLSSLNAQHGYSEWGSVGVKLMSTGLLPALSLAAAGWWRDRRDLTTLCLLVPVTYPVYVLVNRDAHAASFVMTQCLVLWSFPIAQLLLEWRQGALRRAFPAVAVAYVVLASAVSYHNLRRDAKPCDRNRSWAGQRRVTPSGVALWRTSADAFVDAPWCVEMRTH